MGKSKRLETSMRLGDGATITVKQIMYATHNFTRNEIGTTDRGIVYKVAVNNQVVAVEKLHKDSSTATQLREEVYTLNCLEYENIIRVFGSFSKKNLHLLLYEFMDNGSLDRALSDEYSGLKLDWKSRYGICVGIARGLRYMHEEKCIQIIHRDLNLSHILLDGNLKAKISGFRSATIFSENNCIAEVGLNIGHTAPEYAMRGYISNKTDVYSFGVLLLEIMSGESNAIDTSSGQRKFILDKAIELHKNGRLLVDRRLKTEFDEKQANIIMNLAMTCLNMSPASRPAFSQVVDVLEGNITYTKLISPFQSLDNMCRDCMGTGFQLNTSSGSTTKCLDCLGTGIRSETSSSYTAGKDRVLENNISCKN